MAIECINGLCIGQIGTIYLAKYVGEITKKREEKFLKILKISAWLLEVIIERVCLTNKWCHMTNKPLYYPRHGRAIIMVSFCSFFYVGEDNILAASYGKYVKQVSKSTHLLPFFGTDYGLCSLIKPQITFNVSLEKLPFDTLMKNYSSKIQPGIQTAAIILW